MPVGYYRNQTAPTDSLYKVDQTGDSYIFVGGNVLDENNIALASVVNYNVSQVIKNQTGSWTAIGSSTFDNKLSTVLSSVGKLDETLLSQGSYYKYANSYFCIKPGLRVEQVNFNPNKLEYAILRNSNSTYLSNLNTFLVNYATPIDSSFYMYARNYTTSFLTGGGGFGNANLFFTVENLVVNYGKMERNNFGLPRWGFNGNYVVHQKQNGGNGGWAYVGDNKKLGVPGTHGLWLTDVYVDTTSGKPVYYFPNGGTYTYGEQFYIDIVNKIISGGSEGSPMEM